jgi:hypothetical protein
MTNRLLVIGFALAASALAKDPAPVWEEGLVTGQSQDSSPGGFYAAPIGTGVIGVPITRRTNTVDIESGRYHYQWVENTAKSHGYIVLPVGETVRFYREKNWFIIMDARQKKHYFAIVSQRVK